MIVFVVQKYATTVAQPTIQPPKHKNKCLPLAFVVGF